MRQRHGPTNRSINSLMSVLNHIVMAPPVDSECLGTNDKNVWNGWNYKVISIDDENNSLKACVKRVVTF